MKKFIEKVITDYIVPNVPEGTFSNEEIKDIFKVLGNHALDIYYDIKSKEEVHIKNLVDSYPISLPNGKMKEEYCECIKIEDPKITEYWFEGLEELGLHVEEEIVRPCNTEKGDNEIAIVVETLGQSETTVSNIDDVETFGQSEATASNIDNVENLDNTEDLLPNTDNESDDHKDEEANNNAPEVIKTPVKGNSKKGIVIKGMPSQHGDFDIVLKYKYDGWIEGQRDVLERKFKLSIIPDPRSLWKDIPTPKRLLFYKEDSECAYVKVEANEQGAQKDMVAASQRGRSHANDGKARDDDFKLDYNPENGWYVIAVADGAGSAKLSRQGSKIACESASKYCIDKLQDASKLEELIRVWNETKEEGKPNTELNNLIYQIIAGAAHYAHKQIEAAVNANKDSNYVLKDFATTLLFSICKKFDFGWFVASFWVGDGAMCIYDKDNQTIKLLGSPDGGEFAGQTRFLTMKEIFASSDNLMKRLRYSIVPDFTALILMTDGVSDPFFETDANLNKFEKWDAFWDQLTKSGNSEGDTVDLTDDNEASKDQLLKWLDFWSKGNHDDRTIAILY